MRRFNLIVNACQEPHAIAILKPEQCSNNYCLGALMTLNCVISSLSRSEYNGLQKLCFLSAQGSWLNEFVGVDWLESAKYAKSNLQYCILLSLQFVFTMYERVPQHDSEDPPEVKIPHLVPWKRNPTHRFLERICNLMIVLLAVSASVLLVIVVMEFAGVMQLYTWTPAVRTDVQFIQRANTIDKPLIDRNQYRFFHLGSLKVLLIKDPQATVAEAALCVQVGSWNDPKEHQGLAHFLEHMLFQGSHKYPTPGHFQRIVAKSGWSNAYTRVDETNYFFKVQEGAVKEVLDIFAHFFVDPLFDPAMVDKEMNAVNSEYQIGLTSDGWKLVHILNQLSKPTHPLNKFSTGNLATLKDSVPDLLKFHDDYYSANMMSLVVRSSQDMDEFIRNSDFKDIPNINAKRPNFAKFGYPMHRTGTIVKYRIDGSSRLISFTYQVPSTMKTWETQPLRFIKEQLVSRHPDGLYNYLREKNLILELDADTMFEQNGFTFFIIEIVQSKDVAYSTIYDIGLAIVGYCNTMLESLFEEVDDDHVEESKRLSDLWGQEKKLQRLKFDYFQGQVPVKDFARNLNKYPAAKVLAADSQYEHLNPETIYNYLVELANPLNMVILIGDSDFTYEKGSDQTEFLENKLVDQRSDLYNLDYSVADISEANLRFMGQSLNSKNVQIKGEHSETTSLNLQLTELNPYIPKKLKMISLCHKPKNDNYMFLGFKDKRDCLKHEDQYEQRNSFPTLVEKSPYQLWWKVQRSYQTPLIFLGLKLDKFIPDSKDQAIARILAAYWQELLETQLYQLQHAGIRYQLSFDANMHGLMIQLTGWSDGFEKVFADVYDKLQLDLTEQSTFTRVVTMLKQTEQNRYQERLFLQGLSTYLPYLLISEKPSPEVLIQEYDELTLQDVDNYRKQFLQTSQTISLISGNVDQDDAQKIIDPLLSKPQSIHTYEVLNFMGSYLKMALKSKDQLNSAAIHVYQLGKRTQHLYNMMTLLGGSLGNKMFQRLRTELQLGYVAKARFRPYGCVDTLLVFVQGVYEPQLYTTRIDEYVVEMIDEYTNITDEQLEELKQGAIAQLQSLPKSLSDEASVFWNFIQIDYHHFEERQLAIEQLPDITKEQVVDFISDIFGNGRLVLHLYGHQQYETNWVSDDEETIYSQEQLNQKVEQKFMCSHGLPSTI